MNYEDDELERMRARREQRRNASQSGSGRGTDTRRSADGGGDAFRSGYSGPKGSTRGSSSRGGSARGTAGKGRREQKVNNRRRRPDKKKRIMIIAAEILILLVIVVGAAGWYVYERTFGSFQKIEFNEEEVKNPELTDAQIEGMKGYMTIACFGVDSRNVGGKMNVGKGTNSDVNMICSVNLETGEIRLVSVFRDTYLNVNDKNSYNKINYAYAQGGPEQAVKALNKNLGLNITQYATFNWKAVAEAINILGGVDIEITDAEFSYINGFITETVNSTGIGSYQLKSAGMNHLDGVQAVAYARLRLMDTDFNRTERQRKVVTLALEKAKQADFGTLKTLVSTVFPQISTSIGIDDLFTIAKGITKYHIGETAGFPFSRTTMRIGKMDCVIATTLESNVIQLHQFLYNVENYSPSSTVKSISARISEESGISEPGKNAPTGGGSTKKNSGAASAPKETAPPETESVTEASVEETMETTEETEAETTEEETTAAETNGDGSLIGPGAGLDGAAKEPEETKGTKETKEETKAETKASEPAAPETTKAPETPAPSAPGDKGPAGGSSGGPGEVGPGV